jgi:hypothetical protein
VPRLRSTATGWGACVVLSCGSLACGLVVNGEPLADQGGVEADLAHYADLAEELADGREQAIGSAATAVSSAGPWLAWIEPELAPGTGARLGLRRYPDRFELQLPAGARYRVGPALAVTADAGSEGLELRSYALPSGDPLGEQTLGELHDDGYLLALAPASAWIVHDTQVWSWALGPEPIVARGLLADAGVASGSPIAAATQIVATDAPQLLVHAAGRLWQLDPELWIADALVELDELLAVDGHGILYTRGPGLYLREPEGAIRRIDEAIVASGYSLNPTFANIHEYLGEGASLAGRRVVYIASAGVFAFDLDAAGPGSVTPILLEPRWDVAAGIARVEYRAPQVSGASVFVRGLIGESGEVGTSGPVFSVPLDP